MIKFKEISAKNFLSIGNVPIKIKLDTDCLTLIKGVNGSGKSTLFTDAICFVLFNKPYRKINKAQLINSINLKHCLVEITFESNGNTYRVLRGIKPNIFEIYENGQMINQDPNVKDYQKVLEQQILKMNYRSFTQIILLGSASYVPFMKLDAAARREFIEDLLDIRVFSIMNQLQKERIKTQKNEITLLTSETDLLKEKVKMQEKFIQDKENKKKEGIEELKQEIETITKNSQRIVGRVERIQSKTQPLLNKISKFENLESTLSSLKTNLGIIQSGMNSKQVDIDKVRETDYCPKCKQDIPETHRNSIIAELSEEIFALSMQNDEKRIELQNLSDLLEKKNKLQCAISLKQGVVQSMNRTLSVNRKQIMSLESKVEILSVDDESLENDKIDLKKYAKDWKDKFELKAKIQEDLQYSQAANILLQDSGIKSRIIKQYIPVINKIINQYLDDFEFFVSFELDENFNEVVKSRHRDTFTYDSFSEGQKRRIDIALLFAWREVSRLKNSINTNLLIFDEIFDSNLDQTVIDVAFDVLKEMKKSNIFVVSHRDMVADKCDVSINVTMKNNFTEMEYDT